MKYISVRGQSPAVEFQQAAIAGLAPDGGLYVPEYVPALPFEFLQELRHANLQEIALQVAKLYISDIPEAELKEIIKRSLNFAIPLVKLNDKFYLLELFHGPTLAFKDVGARFMAEVLSYYLSKQQQELTIITATSGDTGSAVAHGFYQVPHIQVYVLYPSGRISHLQEQQMTTLGGNIHAIEVEGAFDDCQRLVKQALADRELVTKRHITTANSINIARLVPQIIYYVWAMAQWQQLGLIEPPLLVVPSGNFGNITAAAYAKAMGVKFGQLVAATNANDVVPDYLQTGVFNPKPSIPTLSSAMDVGNPSNLARLQALFDDDIGDMQANLVALAVSDEQTLHEIKQQYQKSRYILDPHTAVAVAAAKHILMSAATRLPTIVVSTAHPAKFPDVVQQALGFEIPLPQQLLDVLHKPKHSTPLSADYAAFKKLLLG